VGLLIGDVTGNWVPGSARSVVSKQGQSAVFVNLPKVVTTNNNITIPVTIQGAAKKGIISYEFDLRYDPAVIQPQEDPVDVAGTASRGLFAVANAEEQGLLRVVVYGPMPIDRDGVLLNLRFNALGMAGSVSALTFERITFNEGDPAALATDGQVELSAAAADQAQISGWLTGQELNIDMLAEQ